MFVIQQGKEKSMGRKSTRENKTIYQQLREEDNLPREKASELLAFISEDRLERIENEKVQPAPEDVIRMSQVYNAPELCNYYCSHECPIGMKIRSFYRDDRASSNHSGNRCLLKCGLPAYQPPH
mgnify:CR=1 FL=1